MGLTNLGIVHTVISLLAVGAGIVLLVRDKKIDIDTALGKFYIASTIVVCLTGFGIFQHGGFGKPHALGIITLIVIAVAYFATNGRYGKFTQQIRTISFSATFFFHIVPGITESATRLPLDHPLASSPEDPRIKMAIGICFVIFLIGAFLQVRAMKKV